MIFKKVCECIAGYCIKESCDLCDLQQCYYKIFGLKINEWYLPIIIIALFLIGLILMWILRNQKEEV